mgnify:CR=1 FL=1
MVLALVAAGCSSDSSDGGAPDAPAVDIEAHGGTGQVWMKSEPGVELELQDADGKVVPTQVVDDEAKVEKVDSRKTDEAGALVMRYVPVGKGYVIKQVGGSGESKPFDVTAVDDNPKQDFYDGQEIKPGYGYLTTRDGTKLAINVTLPGPIEDGPYPTVVEYSGYDPANPEPSLVTISKTLAGGQGFATVGVNVRGSGCSGGSFQLWEDSQAVDGQFACNPGFSLTQGVADTCDFIGCGDHQQQIGYSCSCTLGMCQILAICLQALSTLLKRSCMCRVLV